MSWWLNESVQHLRKFIENSMENKHANVRVQRLNSSTTPVLYIYPAWIVAS